MYGESGVRLYTYQHGLQIYAELHWIGHATLAGTCNRILTFYLYKKCRETISNNWGVCNLNIGTDAITLLHVSRLHFRKKGRVIFSSLFMQVMIMALPVLRFNTTEDFWIEKKVTIKLCINIGCLLGLDSVISKISWWQLSVLRESFKARTLTQICVNLTNSVTDMPC